MSVKAVKYLIIATILSLGILDGFLYADTIDGNTISQIVIASAHKFPVIPLIMGFLLGHWFGDF